MSTVKISPISQLFSLCWLLYVIWLASISVLFLILFFVVFSSQPFVRNFPHFLCTVCKIVVCSQHSFQFKKFNSQSASVLTAADLHSEFPQQILKCIVQCCKILFHYQIRKIIKFLGYLIVCGNEISHLTDTQVLLL